MFVWANGGHPPRSVQCTAPGHGQKENRALPKSWNALFPRPSHIIFEPETMMMISSSSFEPLKRPEGEKGWKSLCALGLSEVGWSEGGFSQSAADSRKVSKPDKGPNQRKLRACFRGEVDYPIYLPSFSIYVYIQTAFDCILKAIL